MYEAVICLEDFDGVPFTIIYGPYPKQPPAQVWVYRFQKQESKVPDEYRGMQVNLAYTRPVV